MSTMVQWGTWHPSDSNNAKNAKGGTYRARTLDRWAWHPSRALSRRSDLFESSYSFVHSVGPRNDAIHCRGSVGGFLVPRISLTDFVSVVSASGTPKATRVANAKNRGPYNPAFDFYKPLRDRIVETHKNGNPRTSLNKILVSLSDPKKQSAYPEIISGYAKWWGKKTLQWISPPSAVFSAHGVDVSINPEVGLEIQQIPHLVKLHFKAEKLSKRRVDLITTLMETALAPRCQTQTVMGVLDVRRSKLFTFGPGVPHISGVIDAELAYVAALWPKV